MTPVELESALRDRRIAPDAFLEALQALSRGDELELRTYAPGEMSLYRTKSIKGDKPTDVQGLSYPPKEKCELQRANLESEQIFYGSSKLPATMSESRVRKGELVIVSKWKSAKELRVRAVPTEPAPRTLACVYNLLFTDPDESVYPYSALVAHWLFELDPLAGLLYPSRLDEDHNDNIALTSLATDELLRLVHASTYEVAESNEDGSLKVNELDFVLPSGRTLDWKGRARLWPEGAGELKPRWNGWGYDCFDSQGNLVDPV
jgi:hypothetical protein